MPGQRQVGEVALRIDTASTANSKDKRSIASDKPEFESSILGDIRRLTHPQLKGT